LAKQLFQIIDLRSLPGIIAIHLHNQIQLAKLDVMLAKSFPNESFNTISIGCTRQRFFACDYPKTGIILAVTSKKYFEMFIRDIFCTNDMVKTIRAQQSASDSKF